MTARACVFVDGENFRHSILDIFENEFNEAEYLPKTANWEAFFDRLVASSKHSEPVNRVRTYWYVTQQVDFFPYNLPNPEFHPAEFTDIVSRDKSCATEIDNSSPTQKPEKLKQIYARLQARERALQKRFHGWTNLQNGITAAHAAIEFRRAGAISYNLYRDRFGQEKCVDVKLALDLLILKDIYDYALIVSGDQDYVPAVQTIKDHGKRAINVSFRARNGKLLPGRARRLNHVTDENIEVAYDELKSFLNIAATTPSPFPSTPPAPPPPALPSPGFDSTVTTVIDQIIDRLTPSAFQDLAAALEHSNQIPPEIDRKLLLGSHTALARDPDSNEKSRARALFRQILRGKNTTP